MLCADLCFGKKTHKILKLYLKQIKNLLNFSGSCVLIGDFNINYKLVINADISKNDCASIFKKFIIKNQPLFQFVSEPTRLNNTTDLVFSNQKIVLYDITVKDPIGSSDHNLIVFKCKLFKPKKPSNSHIFIF